MQMQLNQLETENNAQGSQIILQQEIFASNWS